jgi:hypothetical protein
MYGAQKEIDFFFVFKVEKKELTLLQHEETFQKGEGRKEGRKEEEKERKEKSNQVLRTSPFLGKQTKQLSIKV